MRVIVVALVLLVSGCMTQASRPPQIMAAGGLVYPADAAAQHVEGYVIVAYDVTADGTVADARVVESVPPGTFDEAALKAVRSWHFQPAVRHGETVVAHGLKSRVAFKLGESEDYAR